MWGMGDTVAKDGMYQIVCTKLLQPKIGDVVAKDGRKRIVCMVRSEKSL